MHKYLERVLVVLLHVHYSIVCPIPFLLAAIFSGSSLYRKYYTILPDMYHVEEAVHIHPSTNVINSL